MRLPALRVPRLSIDWFPALPGRAALLYGLYTIVLFGVFLIAQFPHDVLARRALSAVDLNPFHLDFGDARFAWWRGYEFKDVRLVRAGDDRSVPPLFESGSIYIRPGVSGLLRGQLTSVFLNSVLYGGHADGSWVTDNGAQRMTLQLNNLELARYRWISTLLEDGSVGGRLSGVVSAEMRRGNFREGQVAGDLELGGGHIEGVKIKGITVPELNFDTVVAKFAVNGGRIDVEDFRADGSEIRASGSGQITMRAPVGESVLNLKVSLVAGPEANDSIKGLLSLIPKPPKNAKPDAPMTISGTLAQPRVR